MTTRGEISVPVHRPTTFSPSMSRIRGTCGSAVVAVPFTISSERTPVSGAGTWQATRTQEKAASLCTGGLISRAAGGVVPSRHDIRARGTARDGPEDGPPMVRADAPPQASCPGGRAGGALGSHAPVHPDLRDGPDGGRGSEEADREVARERRERDRRGRRARRVGRRGSAAGDGRGQGAVPGVPWVRDGLGGLD